MKILYKVVAAVLAIAVIPVMLFVPMFSYAVKMSVLQFIEEGKEYVADSLSIWDIINTLKGFISDGSVSIENMSPELESVVNKVIVLFVFAGLIAIAALCAAILAIACKKRLPACFASIAGIALSILFNLSFSSLVKPYISGESSLASLVDKWWVSLVANIEYVRLNTGFVYILILFAAVLVWTLAFKLTETPEKKKS